MREIQFQGKNYFSGDWVRGGINFAPYFRPYPVMNPINQEEGHICVGEKMYLVQQHTIGQYTGVKDKNGTKIYEGDIVKTKYDRLCVVEYKILQAFVGFDMYPMESDHPTPDEYDMWKPENLEVVGNIHDRHKNRKEDRDK